MQFVADGLLIATALAAAVYCLVLSRRLRRLTDAEEGIGAQIKALNAALDETRSGLAETRRSVAEARAALRNESQAASAEVRAAKAERASLAALRAQALAAQASLDESLTGLRGGGGASSPSTVADEGAPVTRPEASGNDRSPQIGPPDVPDGSDAGSDSSVFDDDMAATWQPVADPQAHDAHLTEEHTALNADETTADDVSGSADAVDEAGPSPSAVVGNAAPLRVERVSL